jgi:hypothetical protein
MAAMVSQDKTILHLSTNLSACTGIYYSNPLLGNRSYNCEECTLTNSDLLIIKSKIFAQNLTDLYSALVELSNSFPPSALKTLYYSLTHSHLSYSKAKPSCASNPNMFTIFKDHKITNSACNAHTSSSSFSLMGFYFCYS